MLACRKRPATKKLVSPSLLFACLPLHLLFLVLSSPGTCKTSFSRPWPVSARQGGVPLQGCLLAACPRPAIGPVRVPRTTHLVGMGDRPF
ncbi:hypothetical protein J3F84DRAFT_354425 [Trichoderma pleuroticola]